MGGLEDVGSLSFKLNYDSTLGVRLYIHSLPFPYLAQYPLLRHAFQYHTKPPTSFSFTSPNLRILTILDTTHQSFIHAATLPPPNLAANLNPVEPMGK